MIVLGIDPGSRDTGLAVVSDTPGDVELLASRTIHRPDDGRDLLEVPPAYLHDVIAAAVEACRGFGVELIAVERVKRPSWRVGGKVKPLDPTAIMATALVFGAIVGRAWSVPVVAINPGRNGSALPLDQYPDPLATTGKGGDRRRHERSAFDVATQGRVTARFAAVNGGIYV